ncbi:hypothetical protein EV426DRAFT_699682 [Tirmania nivea]|nr:hypothetical protein EV426DRAFT_699682 [Tirmania nivea]
MPHRHVSDPSSPPHATVTATPKNSSDLLCQTRQAKLMLKGKAPETVKLAAPKDKRHIGKGYGEIIDGKTLARLYQKGAAADLKRAQAAEKRKTKEAAGQAPPSHSTKTKNVTIQSSVIIEVSDNELEAWDTDSSSSSTASTLSVITVSTPLHPSRRGITPRTLPSPLTGPSRRSLIHIPSTPSTPHSRVTRSRSKCI